MKSKLVGVVLLLLACAALAEAQHCNRVVVQHHAVVVDVPLVATFVPIYVPTYSVTYADPSAALAEEVKSLRAEIQQLREPARLKAEKTAAPAPAAEVNGLAVLKNQCARCHEKAVARIKGADFVLLDGDKVAKLDAIEALMVLLAVTRDDMPKGGKLTQAEKKAIADLFEVKKQTAEEAPVK